MRIIPADAGSTEPNKFKKIALRDHPRGCGEHSRASGVGSLRVGSSPRMRGALSFAAFRTVVRGIIPADAGSTLSISTNAVPMLDHPRGCGEHQWRIPKNAIDAGSSPRMRGAHADCLRRLLTNGIIPADAGSTLSSGKGAGVYQDHPRGCGEHRVWTPIMSPVSGSSPRMRGAQCRIPGSRYSAGIIPADAGSTWRGD